MSAGEGPDPDEMRALAKHLREDGFVALPEWLEDHAEEDDPEGSGDA